MEKVVENAKETVMNKEIDVITEKNVNVLGWILGVILVIFASGYVLPLIMTRYDFERELAEKIKNYFEKAEVVDLDGDGKFEVLVDNGGVFYLAGKNMLHDRIFIRKFRLEEEVKKSTKIVFD